MITEETHEIIHTVLGSELASQRRSMIPLMTQAELARRLTELTGLHVCQQEISEYERAPKFKVDDCVFAAMNEIMK